MSVFSGRWVNSSPGNKNSYHLMSYYESAEHSAGLHDTLQLVIENRDYASF